MILGYVFTVLATFASGSGSVLESLGVRRAGAYGGTARDLVALRGQYVYFLGYKDHVLRQGRDGGSTGVPRGCGLA